jgi:hypothetical protein
MDIAVVHLRVPRDEAGKAKQLEQNRALLRWSMRHLAKNPAANLIVMGDLNEGLPPGHKEQSLAVLFQAKPPLVDSFEYFKGKPVTHANGGAYDRIILSDALVKGGSGLKLKEVFIGRHSYGKGEKRREYTDHFPVTVVLNQQP